MNELLLVVGAIFVLCAVIGATKGFIKIVASLLTTLVIMIAVVLATPFVGDVLKEYTPIEGMIQKACGELLDTEELQETTREAQIELIEKSDFPEVFKELLLENNNSEVYDALGVEEFGDYVVAYMSNLFCKIAAFLITYILATIVVRVLMYILGIIGDLPVLGGVNRLAGAVLGLVIGLLVVWVLFIFITLFYEWPLSKMLLENLKESPFLQTLYDSNILLKMITKFKA